MKVRIILAAALAAIVAAAAGYYVHNRVYNVVLALRQIEKEQQALTARVDSLVAEIDSVGSSAPVYAGVPLSGAGAGYKGSPSGAPVISMLDRVGLYQKNGTVEIYGADYRPRMAGPVRVRSTEIRMGSPRAQLIWAPDHATAAGATEIRLRYRTTVPGKAVIRVGLVYKDGTTSIFVAGPRGEGTSAPAVSGFPPGYASFLANGGTEIPLVARDPATLSGVLPRELHDKLAASAQHAIRYFFIDITDRAGTIHDIESLGLYAGAAASPREKVLSLAGRVINANLGLGREITLITENGTQSRQNVGTDGRFRFEGIPAGTPVSLRFRYDGMDSYAMLGRWFWLEADRDDIVVDARPRFVNETGKPPPATGATSQGTSSPEDHQNVLAPHTRLVWPGHPTMPLQEYDALTFANNHGYLDRDRFYDNPDGCFRAVHLGSSLSNAQQVPVFQKYNIVMESELGVKLGRCVEVISAGRDNGDIASNYRRLKFYAAKFQPDVVLLENGNSLMMQMQPELLRRYLGVDPEFSMLDGFDYGKDGKLVFREMSPNWPMHAGKPDFSPIGPGIALTSVLMVPFAQMPDVGRAAYKKLADVMSLIRSEFPRIRFILHTGLDQAVCAQNNDCDRQQALPDGRTVRMGGAVLIANLSQFCREQKLDCVNPVIPQENRTAGASVTFKYDSHYSPAGHQWLAASLTDAIIQVMKRRPAEPR